MGRINEAVHQSRFRMIIWYTDTLIRNSMELLNNMIRGRINLLSLRETKWLNEKSKIERLIKWLR